MKRTALFFGAVLAAACLSAQGMPELFQKAKEQVKAGSWQDALKTLDQLDAESAKPGNENARKQLQAPVAFYRGTCDANLGQADKARDEFAVFLQAQPNASIDSTMYSKKAVAAFEEARKSAASGGSAAGTSLAAAYQQFQAPASAAAPPGEFWGDGPVKWLMTPQEKAQWPQLKDGAARADFVEKFWDARNPAAGASGNAFRTEFERRVAFADANFAQSAEQPGSATDRGMVFVLLGPPTYAGRKPLRTGDDASDAAGLSSVGRNDANAAQRSAAAEGMTTSSKQARIADSFSGPGTTAPDAGRNWSEVWHYRQELLPKGIPYHEVDVAFITKKGYGANVLQRDAQVLNVLEVAKKPKSS